MQTDAARAERARAFHMAVFGHEPAAIAFAPGRVNLIGEHTDYNGGLSLPIAIQLGVTCAVSPREDHAIVMRSAQGTEEARVALSDLTPAVVHGWSSYAAGSVAVAMERGWHRGGVSISVDGDVPLGAGLSSSAALECSVLLAVVAMSGSTPTALEIALAAQAAEHLYPGVPCGLLDQATSMLAQDGEALLLDSNALIAVSTPLALERMGLKVLILNTNAKHELNDGGYARRRSECESAAYALDVDHLAQLGLADLHRLAVLDDTRQRRARHVITENARVHETVEAFRVGDAPAIRRLFSESHRSLAQDFEVSCSELDVSVDAALAAGATAARMTGGGFGGSVVALVSADQLESVREGVAAAFEAHGFAAPSFLDVWPSQGARILSTKH